MGCLFWLIASLTIFYGIIFLINGAFTNPSSGTIVPGLALLAVTPVMLYVKLYDYSNTRNRLLEFNRMDFEQSQCLRERIDEAVSEPVDQSSVLLEHLRLGEISRHFDQVIRAQFEFWLTPGGKTKGELIGSARSDLLNDGLFAVLERGDGADLETVRVVTPSEEATREYIRALGKEFADAMGGEDTHRGRVIKDAADELARHIQPSTSVASDLLTAILRMPRRDRPAVLVTGQYVKEGVLLGESIRVGDRKPFTLFPVSAVAHLQRCFLVPGAGWKGSDYMLPNALIGKSNSLAGF
jgi:hypothetical protein